MLDEDRPDLALEELDAPGVGGRCGGRQGKEGG
jgi:hypothetical protein